MSGSKLNRRQFLKMAGITAGGLAATSVLAACAPKATPSAYRGTGGTGCDTRAGRPWLGHCSF